MTSYARFWAVDLHTHTPASKDVDVARFGGSTPEEVVEAAIHAGLDAIAITDHNTTAWCDRMAEAAHSSPLVVLPGVEISTSDGHLLGIWEQGTPSTRINEVLVTLGIGEDDRGRLDIVANVGFESAAKEIARSDGLAIAAHIDRPKGLLKLPVPATVKRILSDPNLAAVEVVDHDTIDKVRNKVGDTRELACVRCSDSTEPGKNLHVLTGLGTRRTWVKASKPDLLGIRHALDDFELRVRLEEPARIAGHPHIVEVVLSGSFLDESIALSPDLNCLLGGTGAGKSLMLDAIRYATDQQVSQAAFPTIWNEVQARLMATMGATGSVRVVFTVDGETYMVERPVTEDGSAPAIEQRIGDDWMAVEVEIAELLPIAAFSQGEALEFSRQPVGRMQLVDSGLDLAAHAAREAQLTEALRQNGKDFLAQRAYVDELEDAVSHEAHIKDRINELSKLFVDELVTEQKDWATEQSTLDATVRSLPSPGSARVKLPTSGIAGAVNENTDLFERGTSVIEELRGTITTHVTAIDAAISDSTSELLKVQEAWRTRHDDFKKRLAEELAALGHNMTLVTLQAELGRLQAQIAEIEQTRNSLIGTERPALEALWDAREGLLDQLHELRRERRDMRRRRANDLNLKTAGIVKLKVPPDADSGAFRAVLEKLKVGSRVREVSLDAIAREIHPFDFVRQLISRTPSNLVKETSEFDESDLGRLLANIEDREFWPELLEAQACSLPDRLNVKFKKPETGNYEAIENLAPGQRCTAVLVVLLADGNAPVIIDQPEDALHAPWIEEYIVERLRSLRGSRQYLFATRSPGIVVGADAEQLVTMKASSRSGRIEAVGSLERHDLNQLALHHLEGGPKAYRRRRSKLKISVNRS